METLGKKRATQGFGVRVDTDTSKDSYTPNKATHDTLELSALDETALVLNLPTNMISGEVFTLNIVVASTTDFTPNASYFFGENNDAPASLEADHRYQFIIDKQADNFYISWMRWDIS